MVPEEELVPMPQAMIAVKLSEEEIIKEGILKTVTTSVELISENIKEISSAE